MKSQEDTGKEELSFPVPDRLYLQCRAGLEACSGSWKVLLVLSGPQKHGAQVAVAGLQLVQGSTWQGLRGRVWKLHLGLLKEEGPWHQPCFFSWEGANGKYVLVGILPFERQG